MFDFPNNYQILSPFRVLRELFLYLPKIFVVNNERVGLAVDWTVFSP
jgi:hypothetical protein